MISTLLDIRRIIAGLLGVYCFAGEGTQWRSRMFAPGGGVAEDQATGSAASGKAKLGIAMASLEKGDVAAAERTLESAAQGLDASR